MKPDYNELQRLYDLNAPIVLQIAIIALVAIAIVVHIYEFYLKKNKRPSTSRLVTMCCGVPALQNTTDQNNDGTYTGICCRCHEGSEMEWI